MLLSVVIPTYNRINAANSCISSILSCNISDIEIIVVNDYKKGNFILDKDNNLPFIKVVDNPKSGVASARNFGVSLAEGEWLLFLDDDMIISKENLNSYFKYLERQDNFCVNIEWEYPPQLINIINKKAFGRFLIKHGFTSMRGWNENPMWPINSSIEVNSIASANLLINRNFFLSTGGYEEFFPFAGFEDYAFSKRLEKYNFKMYVDTTSIMYHNEADRVEPKAWLKRKERGAQTRRIAVNQGYSEIKIEQNMIKKIFYFCSPIVELIIKTVLFLSTLFKFFDIISFTCYKTLLGIYISRGYNKK